MRMPLVSQVQRYIRELLDIEADSRDRNSRAKLKSALRDLDSAINGIQEHKHSKQHAQHR